MHKGSEKTHFVEKDDERKSIENRIREYPLLDI